MKSLKSVTPFIPVAVLLLSVSVSRAEIKVLIEQNDNATATPGFTFKNVPSSSRNDAATHAKFVLVDGTIGGKGNKLDRLHDGKLPAEEDAPAESFFFADNTEGGRVLVDLQGIIAIKQINTYSWHPESRGPQVYILYASNGHEAAFKAQPKQDLEPEKFGWHLVAKVDTRLKYGPAGGQYGVSISDSSGTIGKYRYLLFVISRTESQDPFGNTFFSEMDVVDRNAREPAQAIEVAVPSPHLTQTFKSEDGKCQITIDASRAPDLTNWAFGGLSPVAQKWYPKIVELLPGEGFQAPAKVTIDFGMNTYGFVAITRGNHITCNTEWFRQNLKGEATGCVVHELVHVVQHYDEGHPGELNASVPGWLSEGIADYIRWFIYEPMTHGADVAKDQISAVRYDNGYRPTANFLDWVTKNYDKKLVPTLSALLRDGHYHESFWKQHTGHKLEDLGEEWKKWLGAEVKVK
jgi:hypothetical protein